MKPEDLLALAIPVAFVLFWGSEYLVNRAGGGRKFPKVRWWLVVSVGFFLMLSAINATAPLWLPPEWLAKHRLMDLTGLGPWWGALVGYAATSFAIWCSVVHSRRTSWLLPTVIDLESIAEATAFRAVEGLSSVTR